MGDEVSFAEMAGKTVLLCYNVLDRDGKLVRQYQEVAMFYGVTSVVHLLLDETFEEIYLPPDPSAFRKAEPGLYRLRSTDMEITNPDFIATWTVTMERAEAEAAVGPPRFHPGGEAEPEPS
jgi:hypothetical protein